jgi:hypothetical protein
LSVPLWAGAACLCLCAPHAAAAPPPKPQAFKGVWRIQPGLLGPESSWLVYTLFVRPQAWLPVGLIQNRISREVVSNLRAVQRYTEQLHQQQCAASAPAA